LVFNTHKTSRRLSCARRSPGDVRTELADASTTPRRVPRSVAAWRSSRSKPGHSRAIVVVGHALLDRDVVGAVEHLSPDAPVSVRRT
jgi:hypothetical protein